MRRAVPGSARHESERGLAASNGSIGVGGRDQASPSAVGLARFLRRFVIGADSISCYPERGLPRMISAPGWYRPLEAPTLTAALDAPPHMHAAGAGKGQRRHGVLQYARQA